MRKVYTLYRFKMSGTWMKHDIIVHKGALICYRVPDIDDVWEKNHYDWEMDGIKFPTPGDESCIECRELTPAEIIDWLF